MKDNEDVWSYLDRIIISHREKKRYNLDRNVKFTYKVKKTPKLCYANGTPKRCKIYKVQIYNCVKKMRILKWI